MQAPFFAHQEAANVITMPRRFRKEAANSMSLIASKFCTPPPARLVV